jgi:hypothetical protein
VIEYLEKGPCIAGILTAVMAFAAACNSSKGTGSETHFLACDTDSECPIELPSCTNGRCSKAKSSSAAVPLSEDAIAAFEGCDMPVVTIQAQGPGFKGEVRGWVESTAVLAFDEAGAHLAGFHSQGTGEAWWSVNARPVDGAYYLYGTRGSSDNPTAVASVPGPFGTIDPDTVTFQEERGVLIDDGGFSIARHVATGHLLVVRADEFRYGGPSTCHAGYVGDFTYWLIPFGEGSLADFNEP